MKRFKKLISCLLVLCIVAAVFPVTAFAASSGACGENVTWAFSGGTLTISGTGEMEDYDYEEWEDAPWLLAHGDEITKIVISDGITHIGEGAFASLYEVTSVTMGKDIVSIGAYAFDCCESLRTLTLGSKVSSIGKGAFCDTASKGVLVDANNPYFVNDENSVLYTKDMKTIVKVPGAYTGAFTVPKTVTAIGDYAFNYCAQMTSVTIGENVTSIGERAFASCMGLTKVTIPGNVTKFGYGAFGCCYSLESVVIKNGVTNIGDGMFNDCWGLKKVELPRSVTKIGSSAFSGCYSLSEVRFTGNAPTIGSYAFSDVECTAYYPSGDSTWTTSVRKNYGGTIKWVSYKPAASKTPAAPKISGSNVASTGKNKISWSSVANAVEYKVYRSTSKDGTYTLLDTVTGTSFTDSSAKAGKYYYYYVIAVGSDDSLSGKSNILGRTCDLARPEVTVSNVASTGKVKVSWAAVDGAVKYEVYRATSKDGTYSLLKTTTDLSFTNTSAKAGKTYYYKVKAIAEKSAADSALSSVKSRTCDLARPEVTLSNVASSGKIKVSWAKIDGAVKYEVYRATSKDGTYSLVKTTTSTSFTNTAITAGQAYYYKVKAIAENSAANSALSSVKYRTCDLAQPVVVVTLNDNGKPVVDWDAVSGAEKYTVYIYDVNGELIKTATTTYSKQTHNSAVAGETYSYEVVAMCSVSAATSAKSKMVSITVE